MKCSVWNNWNAWALLRTGLLFATVRPSDSTSVPSPSLTVGILRARVSARDAWYGELLGTTLTVWARGLGRPQQAVPEAEASALAGHHRPFNMERACKEARRLMRTVDELEREQQREFEAAPPSPNRDVLSPEGFLTGPSAEQMSAMAAEAADVAFRVAEATKHVSLGCATSQGGGVCALLFTGRRTHQSGRDAR